jgi:hypothetical protein
MNGETCRRKKDIELLSRRFARALDLATAPEAFKSEFWPWENYLPGLTDTRKAKGRPSLLQVLAEFSPKLLMLLDGAARQGSTRRVTCSGSRSSSSPAKPERI